jgi:general secretion pathway protein D
MAATRGAATKTATGRGSAAAASGFTLESGVSIVADTINNSLLIRATPSEYRKILDALEKLDILPLQVLVEATIVEVRLSGELQYGLQWFFESTFRNDYTGIGGFGRGSIGNFPSTVPGFNWALVDNADVVRALFSTFAGEGLVNVLSSPSVMVLDNHTARIQVGDSVPVATSQQQGTAVTDRVVNTIQYRDTGVMLSVTPRVTPGGLVIMDVEQEVSDAVQSESSALDSPTIQTRNISSSVAVKHQQTVVLGGLIRDNDSITQGGVPGFYQLPLVGWAFGTTDKSATRTELVVVLTPRVISTEKDIEDVNQDFKERLKGLKGRF